MPVQVRNLNLKLIKWTQLRVTTLVCQSDPKINDDSFRGHCTALSVHTRNHGAEATRVPPPLVELLLSNPRPSLLPRQPKPNPVQPLDPCFQDSTNSLSTQSLGPVGPVRRSRSLPPSPSSLLHILDPCYKPPRGLDVPRPQHVSIAKGSDSLFDFDTQLRERTPTTLRLGVHRLIEPRCEVKPLTPTQTKVVSSVERLNSSEHTGKSTIYTCVKSKSSEVTCSPHENGPKPPSEGKRPTEAQLLQVKEKLIEVVPVFFKKPHNYRMYSPNLVFINNFWGKESVVSGLPAYMMELSKARIFSHLKYAHLQMNIVKITIHPDEGCIRVHWRVSGLPQLKTLQFWKFLPWTYRNSLKTESQFFDGFSTFFIGCDELIYKHRVDRLMPFEEPLSEKRPVLAHKLGLLFGLLPRTGF